VIHTDHKAWSDINRLDKVGGAITIIAEKPCQVLGMDLVGPINLKNGEQRNVLIIVDYFTKWIWCCNMKYTTTSEVINQLNENILWSWAGTPETIISDQGSQFVSGRLD
jgi:hypothetical protein